MEIGAQLFSLRTFIETEEQMDETFRKVKEMGYTCVQLSGYKCVKDTGAGFDPVAVKRISDKYGLPIYLTHVPADRLEKDLDAVIADHKAIGCYNIGLGGMPGAWDKDQEYNVAFASAFVEKYDAIAKKIADAGMKFFYHNHSFEFIKMENGQTIMDYLIENAKYFNFTLDTHWVQRGGVSIIEYIKKLNGRIECVHLKDYLIQRDNVAKYLPVGEGVINWCDVVPCFAENGTKYAFVEQDNAVDCDDPFGEMATSARNLAKWGFIK